MTPMVGQSTVMPRLLPSDPFGHLVLAPLRAAALVSPRTCQVMVRMTRVRRDLQQIVRLKKSRLITPQLSSLSFYTATNVSKFVNPAQKITCYIEV